MKADAWAFLVSRNQSVDYKNIVAPGFIDAAKLRGLLTRVTDSDLTPPNRANIRWIQNSAAGNFSIVFRVIKAREADIGEPSGNILKDSFGRDIIFVEGLIFREDPNFLRESIERSHLEQAHSQVQPYYQRFWHSNTIAISQCFPWQAGTSKQILELEELEKIILPPKSRKTGKSSKDIASTNPLPWKQPVKLQSNFLPILVTTAIVVTLFIFLIGNFAISMLFSKDCSYVTQLIEIPYDESKLLETLKGLEKDNKNATLFISTVTPAKPSATQEEMPIKQENDVTSAQLSATQKVEPIVKQENTISPAQSSATQKGKPTFKQENDTIQMKFHPLQQAMLQLDRKSNKKFADDTLLEVRIIKPIQTDRKQCLQRLLPKA